MSEIIEKVAIVGAGAMGGMYAAHFADAGLDVRLVARGERATALRDSPLIVNGAALALGVVDADGPVAWTADLVLFAVKDRHLDEAIEAARAVIGGGTVVLSVLNGLDSEQRIADAFPSAIVPLCIALAMDAERIDGGIRFRQAGRLVFGPTRPGADAAAMAAVQQALDRAGLANEVPDDMRHRLWWKFMVNVGINQASAVLDAPYGAFQHDGEARDLMTALQQEVIVVANAEGVALGDADLAQWHAVLAGQPAEGRTSMHQDARAGRPTEVDSFGGMVVTLGERHGIPTPANARIVELLRG